MNDNDRAQWVDNDEGLYNDRRRSRLSMREYVKRNRQAIDAVAEAVMHPPVRASYR